MQILLRILDVFAAILVVLGGLNWGIMGLCDFNLVSMLLSEYPITLRLIYVLVGLAAVYQIGSVKGIQSSWGHRVV